jgi:protein-S-isoprenylcysteine O-methyltransferase Ste14
VTKRFAITQQRWAGMFANYTATMLVVLTGLWFYTSGHTYYASELNATVTFSLAGRDCIIEKNDVLVWLCIFYAIVLIPYYAMRPGFISDARWVLGYAWRWARTTQPAFGVEERRAALTLVLKLVFVPMMVGFLIANAEEAMQHWSAVVSEGSAKLYPIHLDARLYLLLISLLFAIDVFIFTLGYMVEVPTLDNEIKSVDPTALGWFSCLICYPPFNQVGFAFFDWQRVGYENFGTELIQSLLAYLSIAAATIFVWASVALGLRASNLTNRGVVARGPYRLARHPAYATKILMLCIAALPAMVAAFSNSILDFAWVTLCVAAWSAIYVVRALTEERHLLMIDNGYANYMKVVRFRFIPGVL